eukprot:1359057-Amorphochlora_amoeboformis.AAC.2
MTLHEKGPGIVGVSAPRALSPSGKTSQLASLFQVIARRLWGGQRTLQGHLRRGEFCGEAAHSVHNSLQCGGTPARVWSVMSRADRRWAELPKLIRKGGFEFLNTRYYRVLSAKGIGPVSLKPPSCVSLILHEKSCVIREPSPASGRTIPCFRVAREQPFAKMEVVSSLVPLWGWMSEECREVVGRGGWSGRVVGEGGREAGSGGGSGGWVRRGLIGRWSVGRVMSERFCKLIT